MKWKWLQRVWMFNCQEFFGGTLCGVRAVDEKSVSNFFDLWLMYFTLSLLLMRTHTNRKFTYPFYWWCPLTSSISLKKLIKLTVSNKGKYNVYSDFLCNMHSRNEYICQLWKKCVYECELFILTCNWKQPYCLSTVEWVNISVHTYRIWCRQKKN